MNKCTILSIFLFGLTFWGNAQISINKKKLLDNAFRLNNEFKETTRKTTLFAKQNNWPSFQKGYKSNSVAYLIGVNKFNHPVYYTTFNNTIAAATVGADQLWPGGSTGLNLSGSSDLLKNKLAIWDGGGVLSTHIELVGRITQVDNAFVNSSGGSAHATHVTGTMMATGINPLVKGMSYGLKGLLAYDFSNDASEMSSAAANGLLLSNHSYGTICGWYQDSDGSWVFEGNNGDSADYNFGYYDKDAATWDDIAYNSPNYLIVKAAGNNRNVNGPSIGSTYYYYDNSGNKIQASRQAGISNNNGYDIIGTSGNAKNIITVGAVSGIPAGYTRKEDVVMSPFSSWGPTDDGRIKPDLVADGINVLSLTSTGNSNYAVESGTSMSTPNVTGSLLLLQDYYSQLTNGQFMRSATLKGLAIHTADEAGDSPGPDYKFGWGLLDVKKASGVIKSAIPSNNSPASQHLLYENTLNNNQSYSLQVTASGNSPLIATICWTDPKGAVETANILNNPTPKLVNDLDLRITKDTATYFPWILTPSVPSAAATKGDNHLDNVEKIEIDTVVPGQSYTIHITHKGSLTNGSQAYSLLVSGVGGNAYCNPSTTAKTIGISIDSVSFATIHNKKTTASCATYTNFTNLTATIKPNQTIPLTIRMGSCDGLSHSKIISVYIDYNGNGSFADSGELVATGTVAGSTNLFTTNISTPANLSVGTNTLMRVIAADTTTTNALPPCNTYSTGETQDYKIAIAAPDYDFAATGIVSPATSDFQNSTQLLTVKLTNKGSFTQQNIGLTATIKNGSTVIANLTGNYPSPLVSGATGTYTFQTPFFSVPAANYTTTVTTAAPVDDITSNNSFTQTVIIAPPVATIANNCNNTVNLKVVNPADETAYAWYSNAGNTNPNTTGVSTSLSAAGLSNTIYLSTGKKVNVGMTTKGSASGGYQMAGNNYINYTATVPVILESVRLYTRYPGTVNLMAADIYNATSTSYNYQVLNSKTIDVYATHPSPVNGSIDGNDALDKGAVFYTNLQLPAGNHSIIVSTSDASLFRNNGLDRNGNYPYTIANTFSITGNGALSPTDANDTTFYKAFYYYLYNMKIKTADCVGDRIPVTITTSPQPILTYENDTLKSSISIGNQWMHNGSPIASATSNSYLPTTTDGSYSVTVTDSFGCERKSGSFYIDKISPSIAPNPSRGQFNLSFYVNAPTDIAISLVNSSGQRVFAKSYPGYKGNFSEYIKTEQLASGIYLLQVQHGNSMERNKVLVFH